MMGGPMSLLRSTLPFLFTTTALLAGCDVPSAPEKSLDLSLQLSTHDVRQDSSVTGVVRVINTARYAIHYDAPGRCLVGYEVSNPRDSVVDGTTCVVEQPEGIPTITLAPGDSLVLPFQVRGWFRWIPGSYQVRGLLYNPSTHGVVSATAPDTFVLRCFDPSWPAC